MGEEVGKRIIVVVSGGYDPLLNSCYDKIGEKKSMQKMREKIPRENLEQSLLWI
jgi:2-hydroxy-3-keto-5-methylthiopentenyl-1-phosphate phosphatase